MKLNQKAMGEEGLENLKSVRGESFKVVPIKNQMSIF